MERARSGAVLVFAVALSLFHLYTGAFGTYIPMVQRPVHLAFAAFIVFLSATSSPFRDKKLAFLWDALWAAGGFAVCVYFAWNGQAIMARTPFVDALSPFELTMGVLLIAVVLEGTRRSVGLPVTITAAVFLTYGYWGANFPGVLNHRGISFEEMVDQMAFGDAGIFGTALGVSATYVVLFVILGAFFQHIGTGNLFRDLSFALTSRQVGGPAKMAVLFSSFFGTISGSSVANVYGTGTITIPMMKKVGYEPEVAGGVEATASCGGQIMPPVMGAAAFIMAEFLGISYNRLMGHALIPAFLYFFSIGAMVHFHALQRGIRGIPAGTGEAPLAFLARRVHLLLPIAGLLYFLVGGYSTMRAALGGVLICIPVALWEMLRPSAGQEEPLHPRAFLQALKDGGQWAVSMSMACAAAGIIIGTISQTGLGFAFVEIMLAFTGGTLIGSLVFCMISVIILGMGMPTTVAYLMAVALAVPALTKYGLQPLVAHMFVFYFAVFANITPPVAIASYAGAAIAGGNFTRTSLWAIRLAIAALIIPYMFVYEPSLLALGGWGAILWSLMTAVAGVVFLAAATEGYLFAPLGMAARVAMWLASLGLIYPGLITDVIASAVIIALAAGNYRRRPAWAPASSPEVTPAGSPGSRA